ncbi:transmembrane protein 141-like [Lytechinus pictus]|uniref:transmembrane protein 141-like n=1 Tax=Lytechinus pictus TaxID=7653 RepID=UPI00240D8CA4|nr:transmembrane protein 141-like [Lytechinus pictus]
MVLQSIRDLDDDVYPGVQDYARCQSKAFLKGFIGFIAGAAGGLTASIYARQRYPRFTAAHTVSAIAGGAITCGYLVASIASRDCQKKWVRTAQASGYNDDNVTSPRTVTAEQSIAPQPLQGNTSNAVAAHGGQDKFDGPVSKNKYGDTMD